jgi:hypothetical protein
VVPASWISEQIAQKSPARPSGRAGTDGAPSAEATRLTLVARGTRLAVYLNQQFTYAYDLAVPRGSDNNIWVEPPEDLALTVVDLDNLSFWNLSGLSLP